MKYVLLIFVLLGLVSCRDLMTKADGSIIGREFQHFKKINELDRYAKVSDTVIYGNNLEPKHRIVHLRDPANNLIVFSGITYHADESTRYTILDTIIVQNLNRSEFITIGYCQVKEANDENLIAIVDKTDSLKIQHIKKVWRANTTSNKIEIINDLNGINCFNEWFQE